MLKREAGIQQKMFYGTIEDLMPKEHFLRNLDKLVDFEFVYEKVERLYSNTGRPSIDPVVIVKMLLLGYLYGIDSERKLEQEICVNIAYRWFLGLELGDSVPDHSTISQLRRRKFRGTKVFQEIFDEVVRTCIEAGLVSGKLLLTDSTHILASASKDRREVIEVPDTPSEYMKRLDREAYEEGLIRKPIQYDETKTKEVTKSLTDPESGMLNRPGKPHEFCYLNHQTSDSANGIITDVYVTPGNTHDAVPHTSRITYQIDKFGFETEAVCADAGYDSSEIYADMDERGIKTYIPRRPIGKANCNYTDEFDASHFQYDDERDVYICPFGKELRFASYSKDKGAKRYRAKKTDCLSCPFHEDCCNNSKNPRRISRHMHESARLKQTKNVGTPEYYAAMRLRKIWCEGNFSHQKEQHNLRRTRKRGIEKVTEQCLLSACALNLKRLVIALKRQLTNLIVLCFYPFGGAQADFLLILQDFVNSAVKGGGTRSVTEGL